MEKFCDKLFSAFENQITDSVFCYIQNDKELMKDYLHLIAEKKDLGVVNRCIGKRIAERYKLQSKDLKGIPTSNLIQTYSELEK